MYAVQVRTADTVTVIPVETFKIKGSTLVPVYDNGTTPQDESPFTDVTLIEVPDEDDTPPRTFDIDGGSLSRLDDGSYSLHCEGMNEPVNVSASYAQQMYEESRIR